MPPVGVGANLAMLDGYELAVAIRDAATVREAVRDYEATMLPRSTKLAESLVDHADFLLSEDNMPESLGSAIDQQS